MFKGLVKGIQRKIVRYFLKKYVTKERLLELVGKAESKAESSKTIVDDEVIAYLKKILNISSICNKLRN